MKNKKVNGITLIALVITIIVLLILAGVTINLVLQEHGIFGTAQNASKEYTEAQAKEEIELAILEIQTEELSKGNELTLNILYDRLADKLVGISLQKEDGYLKGEYKGYSFNINSNFQVEMEEKIKGITVSFILKNSDGNVLEGNDYTNGNITLIINASSTEGNITEITTTSGLTSTGNGVYTITANGEYTFTVTDSAENTKDVTVSINKIDKVGPTILAPTSTNRTLNSFRIVPNEADDDTETDGTSIKSGIVRYEYYVKKSTDSTYVKNESTDGRITKLDDSTNLTRDTTYNVYVIAYDKAGNASNRSDVINVKTLSEFELYTNASKYMGDDVDGVKINRIKTMFNRENKQTALAISDTQDYAVSFFTWCGETVYFLHDNLMPISANKVTIISKVCGSGCEPIKDFYITASNTIDFSEEVEIYRGQHSVVTGSGDGSYMSEHEFSPVGSYRYYRLYVTSWHYYNGGNGQNILGCYIEGDVTSSGGSGVSNKDRISRNDLTSSNSIVTASSNHEGYEPYKAFDNSTKTFWCVPAEGLQSGWIQYDFIQQAAITKIRIVGQNNASNDQRLPREFELLGSNDSSFSTNEKLGTYTVTTDPPVYGFEKEILINEPMKFYRYYRINIPTAQWYHMGFGIIEFYGILAD